MCTPVIMAGRSPTTTYDTPASTRHVIIARARKSSASGHVQTPCELIGADDGNRTRMTSLEGVWRLAVMAAELGGSLFARGRD